jgi:hypothetical protein
LVSSDPSQPFSQAFGRRGGRDKTAKALTRNTPIRHAPRHTITRIFTFTLTRALSLMFAVIVAVWLTITVASNSGVLGSEISGGKIGGWFSGII